MLAIRSPLDGEHKNRDDCSPAWEGAESPPSSHRYGFCSRQGCCELFPCGQLLPSAAASSTIQHETRGEGEGHV